MLSCSHMSTERQIQASRENGARSHGPTTPEGKLASSRNATRHGMLSGTIVLKCESTDRFLELVNTLLEEFQPQTPFEESLIENMAIARWRQMRIHGLEKAGMDYEMRRQSEMSSSTENSATRAAIAFRTLSDDSRSLELISRYDTRYDRQYYRAHRCFIETRDRRTPASAQAPQPAPSLVPQSEPEKVLLPIEPEQTLTDQADSTGTRQVAANKSAPSSYRSYAATQQNARTQRPVSRITRTRGYHVRFSRAGRIRVRVAPQNATEPRRQAA
jgi:hypothetical protein